MSKVNIWVGFINMSKNEFSAYFQIDQNDVEKGSGGCQFCKDVDINWYDDDLIGVYKSDSNEDLNITLEELPIAPEEIEKVYNKCLEKNIKKANALFYYADSEVTVDENKKYNDLFYIDLFNWE